MKPILASIKPGFLQIWLIVCLLFLTDSVDAVSPSDSVDLNSVYPVINVNSAQKKISKNGLSAIFKMRLRHWSDGSDVTVFVLPDGDPLHKKFCKQILNVFPHQMRKNWNKLVFSGTGQAPIVLENKEEMIDRVRATPGAVGYLGGDEIAKGIEILEIE